MAKSALRLVILAVVVAWSCGQTPEPANESRSAILPSGPPAAFLSSRPIGDPIRGDERPRIANVQVVDLDSDGLADVLACDALRNRVGWIRQFPKDVYSRNLAGRYPGAGARRRRSISTAMATSTCVVAALGVLMPSNNRVGSVVILENDGRQRFTDHVLADQIARVADAEAGDLDGDGDLDLAVAGFGYDDGETSWLENKGGWKFEQHVLLRLSGPINAIVTDINRDGRSGHRRAGQPGVGRDLGVRQRRPRPLHARDDLGLDECRLRIELDFPCRLDRDGDLDILYSNGDAFDYAPANSRPWQGVQWLENTRDMQFEFHRIADLPGALESAGGRPRRRRRPRRRGGERQQRLERSDRAESRVAGERRADAVRDARHRQLADAPDDAGGRRSRRRRQARSRRRPACTSAVPTIGWDVSPPGGTDMGLRNGGERRSRGKRQSTRPKGISTTWILRLALAVVAALIVFAGAVQIQQRVNVQRLPPLPDLSSQPKAVSEHLLARFDAARADPRSDRAVGALCVAYHADMFHDHADRCYALASALNPDEWRWKYLPALIHSERGEADVVVEAMRQVTEKADFGPAWWRLGEAEFKEGRYDRAEEAWRRALKASEPERDRSAPPSPERDRSATPLGERCGESPPHPAGIPLSAHAFLGLARLALARGNADDARQILERVTTTSPRFSSGFRLLAESYTVLGRQSDADAALRRADRVPALRTVCGSDGRCPCQRIEEWNVLAAASLGSRPCR